MEGQNSPQPLGGNLFGDFFCIVFQGWNTGDGGFRHPANSPVVWYGKCMYIDKYPIIHRVLYIAGGWPWNLWTINSNFFSRLSHLQTPIFSSWFIIGPENKSPPNLGVVLSHLLSPQCILLKIFISHYKDRSNPIRISLFMSAKNWTFPSIRWVQAGQCATDIPLAIPPLPSMYGVVHLPTFTIKIKQM